MEEGNKKQSVDMKMFEIALNTRNFEIKMFWQRCNYFLLLNTSVGAAFALAVAEGHPSKFLIPVIGIFVCVAWIKVGLGGKFWQSYWEQILIDYQRDVGFTAPEGAASDVTENAKEEKNLFSRPGYIATRKRVEKNFEAPLKSDKISGTCECYKRPDNLGRKIRFFFCSFPFGCPDGYVNNVIEKPSVTNWMHYTACFFFGVWAIAFILLLISPFVCFGCK